MPESNITNLHVQFAVELYFLELDMPIRVGRVMVHLFKLSRSGREEMQSRYKRTTERRVSERIHAILLLDSGRNLPDVADILQIHPKTIRHWIRIFVDQGLDALCTLVLQL